MTDKIIVFTAPRTGTHMMVRSLSRHFYLPWSVNVPIGPKTTINSERYVLGSHSSFIPGVKERCDKEGIVYFSLYRNLLDHALSMTRGEIDPNTQIFLEWMKNGDLHPLRQETMYAMDEDKIINYDIISDTENIGFSDEMNKLKEIVSSTSDIVIETKEQTLGNQWSSTWINKKPGYWKEFISYDQYEKIVDQLSYLYPDIPSY